MRLCTPTLHRCDVQVFIQGVRLGGDSVGSRDGGGGGVGDVDGGGDGAAAAEAAPLLPHRAVALQLAPARVRRGRQLVRVRHLAAAVQYKIYIQGDYGGLMLDFVDFDSEVPPVSPFAMPSLPNFHLPKQNWVGRGINPNQSQLNLISNHHGHPVPKTYRQSNRK